jgi:RNA polymerase sigma-70 factor (ECF subfamily)
VRAWEDGDVDAVVALLAEDATITMPPRPTWYRGREAAARFLGDFPLARENRSLLVPARMNGQLAFAHYFWDPGRERFVAHGLALLALRDTQITDITTFLIPEQFGRLGLALERRA